MVTNFRRTKLVDHMRRMVDRSKRLREELMQMEKESTLFLIKHAEMLELNGSISMLQHEFKIESEEIGRPPAVPLL